MDNELACLENDIRDCTLCRHEMGTIPKPVLTVSKSAKIVIAGQAPGNLAMASGRPFADPSGVRLRHWMGVDEATFYDPNRMAIVPMGFCFPGYDKNGSDIPPLKRCAETWRERLLALMPDIQLSLLVGGICAEVASGST